MPNELVYNPDLPDNALVQPNGSPYQQPTSYEDALQHLYNLTGIPDLLGAYQAANRGEYLPALGQGAAAGAAMLPALKPFALAPLALAMKGGKGAENALLGAAPEVNKLMPIRAYHGSPYDFDAFDASKIGTGEGAQSYGHGLYFAENEGVARSYRDALAQSDMYLKNFQGKDAAINHLQGELQKLKEGGARPEMLDQVRGIISDLEAGRHGRMYEVNINADPDTFLHWDKPLSEQPESVQKGVKNLSQQYGPDAVPGEDVITWGDFQKGYSNPLAETLIGTPFEHAKHYIAESALEKGATQGFDIVGMLNEYAPHKVPEALSILDQYARRTGPDSATGEAWYKALANAAPEQPGIGIRQAAGIPLSEIADTSQQLHAAGINGIKYLDQGSRKPPVLLDNREVSGLTVRDLPKEDHDLLGAARDLDTGNSHPIGKIPSSNVEDSINYLKNEAREHINKWGSSLYSDTILKTANALEAGKSRIKIADPTHNYVVFDPKIIEIIKKYGLAALIGGGASAVSGNADAATHLIPVDHDPFEDK